MTIYSERFQNVQPAEHGLQQATDAETGKPVTVFTGTVDPEKTDSATVTSAAQLTRSLDHPNVARTLDVSVEESTVTLVTEGLPGVPLSVYVGDARPSLDDIRQIALELCGGLAYVRARGVTSNIHVEHVTIRNGRVTLDGANLLSLASIEWDGAHPSPINAIVERHAPSRTAQADVYAVGAVLYQLVTGVATGPGDRTWTPAAMALEHFISSAAPPSSLKGSIPAAWDSLVVGALQGKYVDLQTLSADIAALTAESDEVQSQLSTPRPSGSTPDWFVVDDEPDEPRLVRRSPDTRAVLSAAPALAGLLVLLAAGWYVFAGRGSSNASPTNGPAVAQVVGLHDYTRLQNKAPTVLLSWNPVALADRYRLRVKIMSDSTSRIRVVSRPSSSYTMKNLAPGERYTWQVAAEVGGVWGPYSSASTASVPQVATVTVFPTPSVRTPGAGARLRIPVRLCWGAEPSATIYLVRIDGSLESTPNTCLTLHPRIGRHRWAVAAVRNDAHKTTSKFSRSRTFVLLARGNAHHAPKPKHNTKHPTVVKTPSVHKRPTAGATAVVAPTQALVYVAPTAIPTAVVVVPTQAPVVVQQAIPTVAPPTAVPPASPPAATAVPSKSCIPFVSC